MNVTLVKELVDSFNKHLTKAALIVREGFSDLSDAIREQTKSEQNILELLEEEDEENGFEKSFGKRRDTSQRGEGVDG
jgi:hypothetical protein